MAATGLTLLLWVALTQAEPSPGEALASPGEKAEQPGNHSLAEPPPSEWDRQKAAGGGQSEPLVEERSLIGQLAQTLIALLVVCGVIYLLGKVAISRLQNVRFGGRHGSAIKVIERLQLDPRTVLYLVEVNRRRMLLGSGEKGVHLISRLDMTSESMETEADPKPSSFLAAMAKVAGRRAADATSGKEEDERGAEKDLDAG